MSISFTWLGHAAFLFDIDGRALVIDPFLTNNPLGARPASEINAELILLTHAHGDHLGDTVDIAKRTSAKVVSNAEIANWMQKQGVQNAHGQNTGGSYEHDFVKVKQTIAFHSSSFPDGTYGGNPNGFIITTKNNKNIYFAGDTSLFSDMQLIGEAGIDIAFLPIGDNFTMGPEDSLNAIKYLRPRLVVPMHYNTWPLIAVDVAGWADRVNRSTTAQPIVLDPGGTHTVP
jgi:L-ascorbate metabolism protein UlaG (beta-lactamase superfamily)